MKPFFFFCFLISLSGYGQRKAYIRFEFDQLEKVICTDSSAINGVWCKKMHNNIMVENWLKDSTGKVRWKRITYQDGSPRTEHNYTCNGYDSCVSYYYPQRQNEIRKYNNGLLVKRENYDPEGFLRTVAEYDSTSKTTLSEYYSNGKKKIEVTEKNGKPISRKYWNEQGIGLNPKKDVLPLMDFVLMMVEEHPEFPGGETELQKFIEKNTKYPEISKELSIQGKVYFSFTVLKDGAIGNTEIIRSPDMSLNAEVLRVINSLPKWKPASINGINVDHIQHYVLNFRLN